MVGRSEIPKSIIVKKLICIIFVITFGHSAFSKLPLKEEGLELDVTLCTILKVPADKLESEFFGEGFGLTFVFLISRKSDEAARFALKELKDFRISGQRYSGLSDADSDSHTVIDDVVDLQADLGSLGVEIPARKSLVMTTTIVGSKVELHGNLEVSPEFSWGGKLERFDFSVPAGEVVERE